MGVLLTFKFLEFLYFSDTNIESYIFTILILVPTPPRFCCLSFKNLSWGLGSNESMSKNTLFESCS